MPPKLKSLIYWDIYKIVSLAFHTIFRIKKGRKKYVKCHHGDVKSTNSSTNERKKMKKVREKKSITQKKTYETY